MALTAVERQAVEAQVQALREAFGERLERVILFGSKVRGDDHEESDVDLLVVLSDAVSLRDTFAVADLAYDGIVRWSIYIHTVVLSQAEFDRPRGLSAFVVADAEEEGVPL
jgi:hypothetical protein